MTHIPTTGWGKGDTPRAVDKKKYDESWIRCFGKECPDCQGEGGRESQSDNSDFIECMTCNGIGKVER